MSHAHAFESEMETLLTNELGQTDGASFKAQYTLAKQKLTQNIYGFIQAAQPSISDHGLDHINNVLSNAYDLLGDSFAQTGVSSIEAYCLGMMILFHDVGNLEGRENHRSNITKIFDWVRGTDARVRPEKTIVTRAAWAHTGEALDKTKDTLKDLPVSEHLERRKVRLRSLAAILRFADELAEGPQRTSEYMRTHNGFDADALKYHDYASMTHVHIDRGNSRIALKYEVDIKAADPDQLRPTLTDKLTFIYDRIAKLDQERRYARFYCDLLSPFARTEVTFNFHHNGIVLPPLVDTLELTDKVVPGTPQLTIDQIAPEYKIDALVTRLMEACEK